MKIISLPSAPTVVEFPIPHSLETFCLRHQDCENFCNRMWDTTDGDPSDGGTSPSLVFAACDPAKIRASAARICVRLVEKLVSLEPTMRVWQCDLVPAETIPSRGSSSETNYFHTSSHHNRYDGTTTNPLRNPELCGTRVATIRYLPGPVQLL